MIIIDTRLGIIRKSSYPHSCGSVYSYDAQDSNLYVHLTNAAMQKKAPRYAEEMENSIWRLQQMEECLVEQGHVAHGWVDSKLVPDIMSMVTEVLQVCELDQVSHGVAWQDVAWRGVVWYGMVWCGVVWCGGVPKALLPKGNGRDGLAHGKIQAGRAVCLSVRCA